ncbi:hypothetical protein [Kitasatospora aureofaciens]|uniref:hypothetical protein n=1 Tax=Kitasatospora aureofaciens TaxID=1894 RepID=UPI0037FC2A3B
MEHYRTWRLCQIIGPPTAWADMPAVELDWLLAVDDAVAEARANVERRESERG